VSAFFSFSLGCLLSSLFGVGGATGIPGGAGHGGRVEAGRAGFDCKVVGLGAYPGSSIFPIPCRFSRPPCACTYVMKKFLTTLVVAASAAIHAQPADLASQLPGYWQPDVEKTVALAKKANHEMDPLTQAMMGKMVFEFQKDKMTVHGPQGFTSDTPPIAYKVTAVDKAANALTLNSGGQEMKVRFDKGQMALNDPESGWMIFNRMSKEDFAKRAAGGAATKAEDDDDAPAAGKLDDASAKPIPGEAAAGKVGGKGFKVDNAALDQRMSILELGHGEDMKFVIFLFADDRDAYDGKKYKVTAKQDADTPHIHMRYKVEGKDMPESEIFTSKYTMKLEFGTAKDGKIPGKIELRLPDKADSFVAGTFEAEID
jgi:hypothetical protein